MTHKTNLAVLKRSRHKPNTGDVFAYKVKGLADRFFFGRVVATDATLGGFPDVILVYLYKASSPSMQIVPILSKSDLLMPPVGIDATPWTRGHFLHVENDALGPNDVLAQHCFYDPAMEVYRNEYGQRLIDPSPTGGAYLFTPLGALDDKISRALGLPGVEQAAGSV